MGLGLSVPRKPFASRQWRDMLLPYVRTRNPCHTRNLSQIRACHWRCVWSAKTQSFRRGILRLLNTVSHRERESHHRHRRVRVVVITAAGCGVALCAGIESSPLPHAPTHTHTDTVSEMTLKYQISEKEKRKKTRLR